MISESHGGQIEILSKGGLGGRRRPTACTTIGSFAEVGAKMNNANERCYYTTMSSPVGTLLLTATDRGLSSLHIGGDADKTRHSWVLEAAPFYSVVEQLERYFRGVLGEFRVALDLRGTPFELLVWGELQRIAFGQTISYGELARRIGRPSAARAVGAANGRNPVGIIVPCHRVIGSDGSLTGYAGGLKTKRALLDHEASVAHSQPLLSGLAPT